MAMREGIDIRTEDLHIRHFTMDDLENHYQVTTQAFESETTHERTKEWLTWTIDNYRELARLWQPPYGDYAIDLIETGEFVGSVGIVQTIVPWGVLDGKSPEDHHHLVSPEFGLYWGILPVFQRKGFATQAGRAIIEYLFHNMQVKQVVATTDYDNIASQKTMEKLGMTLYRNPTDTPPWCQVVGRLNHPQA